MDCPHTLSCPLYKYFKSSDMLAFWKDRYCHVETKWPQCARYELSQQGKKVPITLMPNGKELRK